MFVASELLLEWFSSKYLPSVDIVEVELWRWIDDVGASTGGL